jgi:hypothetical protein
MTVNRLFSKSTWLHLRFPFSVYLMPIFFFATSVLSDPHWPRLIIMFIMLHFFLYPASNAYNSYFDKDTESIGGLKNPPAVNTELYYVALLFDLMAIILAWYVHPYVAVMAFIYGLVSKAYSHPLIRLKKYPWISTLAAAIFQGGFTFWMVISGITQVWGIAGRPDIWFTSVICSVMLMGYYPLSQVYQHGEDERHGDLTLSRKLGIMGTFHFSLSMIFVSGILLVFYFFYFSYPEYLLLMATLLLPSLIFLASWYFKVRKDNTKANFDNTMKFQDLSSAGMGIFFMVVTFWLN